jgi:Papain family cysteine protease
MRSRGMSFRWFGWLAVFYSACGEAHGEPPRLPERVSLIADFEQYGLTPLAQGDRDVCSLFAITAVAEFEHDRHAKGSPARLSEEYLIWAAKKATGKSHEQAMFYEAVEGLDELGMCPADLMRYAGKPDPRREPSAEALRGSRPLRHRWRAEWIKRWSVDAKLTDGELAKIKRALADGHPVACGLRWPKKLSGSELLAVPPPDGVYDGHSIVLVGYENNAKRPGGGVFQFRNSNGPAWGDKGYGLMSYAYVRSYANDALWLHFGTPGAEVPTVRHEAESMPVLSRARADIHPQAMNDFQARMWSGGRQLFCGAERGGSVELGFDVAAAGRYRLRILGTAAPDFGAVEVALDGRAAGAKFDLYSGRVCPSGSLELGAFDLGAGRHRLRVTAVEKNAQSQNYFFGLDALDLFDAPRPEARVDGDGKKR